MHITGRIAVGQPRPLRREQCFILPNRISKSLGRFPCRVERCVSLAVFLGRAGVHQLLCLRGYAFCLGLGMCHAPKDKHRARHPPCRTKTQDTKAFNWRSADLSHKFASYWPEGPLRDLYRGPLQEVFPDVSLAQSIHRLPVLHHIHLRTHTAQTGKGHLAAGKHNHLLVGGDTV